MNKKIMTAISTIRTKYETDGFIILGVFGSVARGEERDDSDVDILYQCGPNLPNMYSGLKFFSLYEKVKSDLESILGRRVDLADINGLNEVGRKYILQEVQYVRQG